MLGLGGLRDLTPVLLRTALTRSGPALRHVGVGGCASLPGDKALVVLADVCPGLEQVNAHNLRGLSNAGLSYLEHHCPSLRGVSIADSDPRPLSPASPRGGGREATDHAGAAPRTRDEQARGDAAPAAPLQPPSDHEPFTTAFARDLDVGHWEAAFPYDHSEFFERLHHDPAHDTHDVMASPRRSVSPVDLSDRGGLVDESYARREPRSAVAVHSGEHSLIVLRPHGAASPF